jgi:hypothetical protein
VPSKISSPLNCQRRFGRRAQNFSRRNTATSLMNKIMAQSGSSCASTWAAIASAIAPSAVVDHFESNPMAASISRPASGR